MSLADRHIETAVRAAVVLAAWLWAIAASAQDVGYNWVRVSEPLVGTVNIDDSVASRTTTTVYDGLGRPLSVVRHGAAANGGDMADYRMYDNRGNLSRQYLPINTGSTIGSFENLFIGSGANNYYYDNFPYSETLYDHSDANRPTAEFAPGAAWRADGGHSVNKRYTFNTDGDNSLDYPLSCLHLYVDDNGNLARDGYYPPSTLRVVVNTDEDGHSSMVFTTKSGRQVLLRQCHESGIPSDTYWVYDIYGRVRYIVSPEAAYVFAHEQSQEGACDVDLVERFCYVYQYDERDRVVVKKLPGNAEVHYVYDRLNRVIFSQDGVQRQAGEWSVRKYDARQRLAVEGRAVMPEATRQSLQQQWGDTLLTATYDSSILMEYNFKYSGTSDLPQFEVDKAYYYDDYSFWDSYIPLPLESGYTNPYNISANGVLTGTALSDYAGGVVVTLNGTDEKGRVVVAAERDVYGNSHLVKSFMRYDFAGRLVEKTRYTQRLSERQPFASYKEQWQYTYDNFDRPLTIRHRYGNKPWRSLGDFCYNDLGQVVSFTCGDVNNPAIATDYSYNIRGWLTAQEGVNYGQSLYYTAADHAAAGYTPCYNGNLAAMSETYVNAAGNMASHMRYFTYDHLNMLTRVRDGLGLLFDEDFVYDLNGNVATIRRGGEMDSYDELTLGYDGNRLVSINDTPRFDSYLGEIPQFVEGDYIDAISYDLNGRPTADASRGITQISYNPLSLPRHIAIGGNDYISRGYRADGKKWREKASHSYVERVRRWDRRKKDSVWVDITRFDIDERLYFGDMVASGTWGEPVRIYNEAGYIDIADNDSVSYHFYERDRLGSVHAIVAEDGTLEQHTDYHSGGLPSSRHPLAAVDNRLHTGKEFQNFRGIALYDNLARLYDPLTTRFTTVDPLAERTPWLSPYTHCANNPLRFIDPTGKELYLQGDDNSIYSTLNQIHSFCPGILLIYSPYNRQLTYDLINKSEVDENSEYLMAIIKDPHIKVHIRATNEHSYNNIHFIGGAFWGAYIKDNFVETLNIINPKDLELIDTFHLLGTSIMHEITESYIAGNLSLYFNTNTLPAYSSNKRNTIYNIAHASALPQVPLFYYDDAYDKIKYYFIEDDYGKQYIVHSYKYAK